MLDFKVAALLLAGGVTLWPRPLFSAPTRVVSPRGNLPQDGLAPQPVKCAVVAKGRDFVVHAVPNYDTVSSVVKSLAIPAPPPPEVPLPSDYSLVHTKPSTGAMHVLFAPINSHWVFFGGYDREYWTATHLVGVVADQQRVYILIQADHRSEFKDPLKSVKSSSDVTLHVFWLASGDAIFSALVKTQPKEVRDGPTPPRPYLALGLGPLQRSPSGISVYGRTFRFNGQQAQKEAQEAKTQ